MSEKRKKRREFKLTTSALNNANTVYLSLFILIFAGFFAYFTMPREMFPDIVLPKIIVKTVYPGNPPADMENLVTKPLEKEIYTIKNIKTLSSTSSQDNSDIIVDFNSGVDLKAALQDVKDAVDRAKSELPDDLPADPVVFDVDMSEFPIININLSGDFSSEELKQYAEDLQDKIEDIPEISKVNIKGAEDRLIRLNLDKDKMDAFQLGFTDIENAVKSENISVSGGDLIINGTRRSVRTDGEFKNIKEIENIIVKSEDGKAVYLKDVLENGKVIYGFKDRKSIARLNGNSVVSLQIIKKSGKNLLNATDAIMKILAYEKTHVLPAKMNIEITNDQSDMVKKMIQNLENSIILGMIFVMSVLFFFLGAKNALYVGLAIPASMLISFVILNSMGITINMMTLFGLILALGMLVDNAIVAVENIFRFISEGYKPLDAARYAVGEIAWAIIASTATTLAAFVPLIFWPGIIGNFMKFLPLTLVVVMSASLFVALVIIPVVATGFSQKQEKKPSRKKTLIIVSISLISAIILYVLNFNAVASLLLIVAFITLLNYLVLYDASIKFKDVILTKLEKKYSEFLNFALSGKNPILFIAGTFLLLVLTLGLLKISEPKVDFFPVNDPKYLVIKTELPLGYDITATDSVTELIEKDVKKILMENNYTDITESILSTIGEGAVAEGETAFGTTPYKSVITVNFKDYEFRNGKDTKIIQKKISDELIGKYPGVILSIDKNQMGPPTGKAVNIELSGEDFDTLKTISEKTLNIINESGIKGIESLRIDLDDGKPELLININREKARRYGLSTGQIASEIRTALFGKEISDFKAGEEKYPVQIQFSPEYRNDISALMNQIITFRNKQGRFVHIPVSAVADYKFSTTYGSVKRIDTKRVVTISSNVLEGFNANIVNRQIKAVLKTLNLPDGYEFNLTGEQKDQREASDFLIRAAVIAVSLIMIIMVTQFNSVVKPFIIMTSVLFSTIGVLGGLVTFRMDFVIVMTGIGIISLAGVVVNNAIVLIDYIDYLKKMRKNELGLDEKDNLPLSEIKEIIKKGGQTRLRPVLLTAITTILGLLPMATGFNIDFKGLITDFKPDIYFGGDNAVFWGPMAWTVIFGLTFATFLTLVIVPVMYLTGNKIKLMIFDKEKVYA
ncbi:MAG: efflux RND transporter permease subunit [Chlorobi bacterium]|nr:efflux RND transporter permease subunit [Chlorobiota bacterium]